MAATIARPLSTPSRAIRARSAEVVAHHRTDGNPDKPLLLLIPGGALAALSFGGMWWLAWGGFVSHHLEQAAVIRSLLLMLLPYYGSILLFSYGYELYDFGKALKLTLLAGTIGLAAVFIVIALVVVIAKLFDDGDVDLDVSGVGDAVGGAVKSFIDAGGQQVASAAVNQAANVGVRLAGSVVDSVIDRAFSSGPTIAARDPDQCSQCAQLPDPSRVVAEGSAVSPEDYCPKCRQLYLGVKLTSAGN